MNKRNIFKILLITSISLLFLNAFADTWTGSGTWTWANIWTWTVIVNEKTEEDLCFEVLTKNVKKEYNIDLTSVEQSFEEGNNINLSTYKSFKNHTFENSDQKYMKNSGLNLFSATRNNIWTIKAKNDYILSQFTWFWDETNFTFPLKSSNRRHYNWEKYPDFRQNIVYTHHLLNWSFLSCWFLKVEPKWTHDNFSIAQTDYKTNVFDWSWFEIVDNSVILEWKNGNEEFLVWKVKIAAEDYSDNPLFKIKLITVAYNNNSNYFNEFITFPKQVSAMTNADSQSEWMPGVMIRFFNKVKNDTCLKLVHKKLPNRCKNTSMNWFSLEDLYSYFIKSANASIEAVEWHEDIMEEARWMIIYDWLPLDLYEKIMKINDENLKNSLIAAIVPNFEDTIKHKTDNWIALTPFERVFYSCDMDYTERMDNVIDFVENFDLESKIDYNNFDYLNSKFWDCIIPYPDKDNIWKIVKNWFSEINSPNTVIELEENVWEKIESVKNEISSLEIKINELNSNLQRKLDNWEIISDNELNEFNNKKEEFNVKYDELNNEFDRLAMNSIDVVEDTSTMNNKKTYLIYTLILFFVLIGTYFIYLSFRKKDNS